MCPRVENHPHLVQWITNRDTLASKETLTVSESVLVVTAGSGDATGICGERPGLLFRVCQGTGHLSPLTENCLPQNINSGQDGERLLLWLGQTFWGCVSSRIWR